jgi:hypothetical protein
MRQKTQKKRPGGTGGGTGTDSTFFDAESLMTEIQAYGWGKR